MRVHRSQVRVFNQPRYVHIGIVYIKPEIVRELAPEPGNYADDGNVIYRPVFIQNLFRMQEAPVL